MKKIICLIIILFIPLFVVADSTGPSILGYDAVVINPNGAKVNDSDEVVPYNSKIHVYDEMSENNKIYASVCYMKEENCGRWTRYILLSDIIPVKEEIKSDDIKGFFDEDGYGEEVFFEKTNDKLIIFEKDGFKLSKGPSDVYGKYDKKVDYMTHLKASYVLMTGGGDGSPSYNWYYIDDGTNMGWLKLRLPSSEYAIGVQQEPFLVFTDTKIYDADNNLISTIPSETLLYDVYYINKEEKYYIEYNGVAGFTKQDNYGTKVPGFILTVENTKIMSMDGKILGEIPLGKVLKNIYGNYVSSDRGPDILCGVLGLNNKKYYYVEYNKVKGFVLDNSVESFITYGDEEHEKEYEKSINKKEISFEHDVDLHELNHESEDYLDKKDYKIIDKIPSGTNVISLYSSSSFDYNSNIETIYYLVNYKGTPGWIVIDNEVNTNTNQTNDEKNTNDNSINKISNKSNNTIYYAIASAAVVSIIAIIAIVLVNKKKKNKVLENKENEIKNNDNKDIVEKVNQEKNINENNLDIKSQEKRNVLEEEKNIEEKDMEKKD